jgi:hypothetical protein
VKGSCLCGAVSYEIDGPIGFARYCHCASCRKFSGTAYAAWGLVRTDQFSVATPDARVTKYDSGGGLRVFCASCGSALWYEPAELTQFRGIPLGAIDDPGVPQPTIDRKCRGHRCMTICRNMKRIQSRSERQAQPY